MRDRRKVTIELVMPDVYAAMKLQDDLTDSARAGLMRLEVRMDEARE